MNSADELNNEIMRQLLLDAISEQVEDEIKNKETSKSAQVKKEASNDKPLSKKKENENKNNDSKSKSKKPKGKSKKKKKSIKEFLKDEAKVKTLLVFMLALIVNTYAWFLYVSMVSTSLDIHITSWLFEFSESEDTIILNIDRIFPGMETFTKDITGIQ